MANAETTAIEGTPVVSPTLEESHAALVADGTLSGEDGATGALTENTNEDGRSNDPTPSSLDKFKDPKTGEINIEALQKSYLELEKKKAEAVGDDDDGEEGDEGAGDNLSPEDFEVQDINEEPTAEDRKFATEAAKRAGLDLHEMSTEWFDNGELSEDTFASLEAAGYPKDAVEVYIKGLTAGITEVSTAAHAIVGGAEGYDEMTDWAIENLSDDEQDAFDIAVNSGNKASVLQAVRGLHAQFKADDNDGTVEPDEQLNTSGGKASGSSYTHMDDYMNDMDDPRYETSETYRQTVAAKLGRSNL